MICAIYKSSKRAGMYLYIAQRDQFSPVPDALRQMFGTAQFVMLFNLEGQKSLQHANNQEVKTALKTQGFYLQMPPPEENLHKQFVAQQKIKLEK